MLPLALISLDVAANPSSAIQHGAIRVGWPKVPILPGSVSFDRIVIYQENGSSRRLENVERRQNHDAVANLLPRLMLISCHSACAYHFFTFAGVSFNQNSGALISLSSCCVKEGLINIQSMGNRDGLAKNSRFG